MLLSPLPSPRRPLAILFLALAPWLNLGTTATGQEEEDTSPPALTKALTFHAAFDDSFDADFALGDPRLYSTPSGKLSDAKVGLTQAGVKILANKGRYGGALQFTEKTVARIFFKAEKNVAYRREAWSGTISFWLSLDPQKDLKPGFSDPIQVTDDAWNRSALWVDFSKDEIPRHFRFGAFADFEVWNPQKLEFDDIPDAERPWIVDTSPPFSRDRWTHVAMTFNRFNSGKADGVARLYLDGKLRGELTGRKQTFTWELSRTVLFVGLSYIGLIDDLACFNRALDSAEVLSLLSLPKGIGSLKTKPAGTGSGS